MWRTTAQIRQESTECIPDRENGAFNFVAGTEGLELNVDSAVRTISDYLENSWTSDNTAVLNLETQVTEPGGKRRRTGKY